MIEIAWYWCFWVYVIQIPFESFAVQVFAQLNTFAYIASVDCVQIWYNAMEVF
jgi:hypothetical protein